MVYLTKRMWNFMKFSFSAPKHVFKNTLQGTIFRRRCKIEPWKTVFVYKFSSVSLVLGKTKVKKKVKKVTECPLYKQKYIIITNNQKPQVRFRDRPFWFFCLILFLFFGENRRHTVLSWHCLALKSGVNFIYFGQWTGNLVFWKYIEPLL